MWSGLCDCGLPIYFNNPKCSSCMASKAKQERTTARTQQKQAKDIAKQLAHSKGTKTAIKPVSQKQAAINAEKSRIKKRMQAERNVCFTCEAAKGETLSHIIIAKNKAFELIPANLVLECFSCHSLYENFKAAYAAQHPDKWQLKLDRAKQLSNTHFEQLKDKAQ